jgi:hypothetical protein
MNRSAWALGGCLWLVACPGLPPADDDDAERSAGSPGEGGAQAAAGDASSVVPGLGGTGDGTGDVVGGATGNAGGSVAGMAGGGRSQAMGGAGSISTVGVGSTGGSASETGGTRSMGGSSTGAVGSTGGAIDVGGSGSPPVGGAGSGMGGATVAGMAGASFDAPPCEDATGQLLWSGRVTLRTTVSGASDGFTAHSFDVFLPDGLAGSLGCGFLLGGSLKNGTTGAHYFAATGLGLDKCFDNDLAALGASFEALLEGQSVKLFPVADDVHAWTVSGICQRVARNDWSGSLGDIDDTWEIWGTSQ